MLLENRYSWVTFKLSVTWHVTYPFVVVPIYALDVHKGQGCTHTVKPWQIPRSSSLYYNIFTFQSRQIYRQ